MTLPASFPLSMSQIATELGKSLPLSILDPWVIALAGKSAAPVSFSNLLGKTGSFSGNVTFTMGSGTHFGQVGSSSPQPITQFFGGSIFSVDNGGDVSGSAVYIRFDGGQAAPNWANKIALTNNVNGKTAVCTKSDNFTWFTTSAPAGTCPGVALGSGQSAAYSITIKPSA